jgi:hypothetical protein
MKDSDPRPMTPTVLAAYSDPLNLKELLASVVFTDRERFDVRDKLLERLISKHGSVEVLQNKRFLPIRERVSKFKKRAWNSIEVMVAAEEYGGRDSIMLDLATIMQPYWHRWWETFSFAVEFSRFEAVSILVLGDRQLRWISAQLARVALPRVLPSNVDVCISAIEAAEEYCESPSFRTEEPMLAMSIKAGDAASLRTPIRNFRSYNAARASASASQAHPSVASSLMFAFGSFASSEYSSFTVGEAAVKAEETLNSVVRSLITPTLITRPSRGLR